MIGLSISRDIQLPFLQSGLTLWGGGSVSMCGVSAEREQPCDLRDHLF